jgi:uncharacterized membrane protein (UPF0127 family)
MVRLLVLILGLLAWAFVWPAAAEGVREPLTIQAGSGARHVFQVEVADDPGERAQGLMFRRSMAADHGMLFDFRTSAEVGFWMENTYLPLDLLFIRADGRIARISRGTPLSREVIPSGEPVLAVLELNAGTAARLGIRPGDLVRHRVFRNVQPAARSAARP